MTFGSIESFFGGRKNTPDKKERVGAALDAFTIELQSLADRIHLAEMEAGNVANKNYVFNPKHIDEPLSPTESAFDNWDSETMTRKLSELINKWSALENDLRQEDVNHLNEPLYQSPISNITSTMLTAQKRLNRVIEVKNEIESRKIAAVA